MATVLRTWLLVLLLVHHATSTFDAFGCIKGFSCFKNLQSEKVRFENIIESNFNGYELIGFMPTNGGFKAERKEDWIDMWSSRFEDPLGDGAYLFEKYVVARDSIKHLSSKRQPKVCSVFARKDKLESWQWTYVPRYVEVYKIDNGIHKLVSLHWDRDTLKVYLKVLKYSDEAHSGVLVTDWRKNGKRAPKNYLMKIPKAYLDDTIFYCRGLTEALTPEYLKILKTNLNWEKKFGSVWKLVNYPTPMAITAKERLQDGMMLWSPRWNTGTSAQQDAGEGSTVDKDTSGPRSGIKSARPARAEEEETIETPE